MQTNLKTDIEYVDLITKRMILLVSPILLKSACHSVRPRDRDESEKTKKAVTTYEGIKR